MTADLRTADVMHVVAFAPDRAILAGRRACPENSLPIGAGLRADMGRERPRWLTR